MAKPAARVGDPLSHGGSIIKGSSNVFINGKPAAYVSSEVNCSSDDKQTISKGSSTVFINGKPAVRVNDTTSCGATVTSGSPNVFIGDGGSPISPEAAGYILSRQQTPMSFAELAALLGVAPFGMTAGATLASQFRSDADPDLNVNGYRKNAFAGKETNQYDQHFVVVDSTGQQPAEGVAYSIKAGFGEHHDMLDIEGKTVEAYSSSPQEVSLKYAVQTQIGVAKR
ncbi:PAAR domain-containing protein [Paraherbaspirillum soli]|uniref:PAAR domain-containing protein n=1 Tax=Paraherbaspirillum soli TaxID=631222 RepID=A0ABW0M8K2_9BURK